MAVDFVKLSSMDSIPKTKVMKNTVEKNIESKNDSIVSSGTIVNIGLGIVALSSIGMYLVSKGKAKLNQSFIDKAKHLDIDAFKTFGKFEKGKAFLNGKEFTGSIFTKNGTEMIYKDGVIEKSVGRFGEKFYRNGKVYCINHNYDRYGGIKQTLIEYKPDGTRVITQRRGGYDNQFLDFDRSIDAFIPEARRHDIITTINPDGTVTRVYQNLKRYNSGVRKEYTIDKVINLNTGKTEFKLKGSEFMDDFSSPKQITKRKSVINGKKVVEEVDKSGNVVRSYTTEFNPKTGISTQVIKEGHLNTIVQRDKNGYVLEKVQNGPDSFYSLWDTKTPNCDMGQYSTANRYMGVSKEKVLEYIQKNGLQFNV